MKKVFFVGIHVRSMKPMNVKCPHCKKGDMFLLQKYISGPGLVRQEACDNEECFVCTNESPCLNVLAGEIGPCVNLST